MSNRTRPGTARRLIAQRAKTREARLLDAKCRYESDKSSLWDRMNFEVWLGENEGKMDRMKIIGEKMKLRTAEYHEEVKRLGGKA